MKYASLLIRHRVTIKRCITFIAVLSLLFSNIQMALAATLITQRIYMNRQQADVASGQSFAIFFTTSSTGGLDGTADEIRVIFPDGDDGKWCRTAGALGAAGTANPEGATETATVLPGTLSATCAAGSGTGSAESNSDRIIITGSTAIANSTKYGVQITDDVGVGITGTAAAAANNIKVTVKTYETNANVEDTAILALSLISNDQVVVSALVDVTLTVVVDTNSVSLGTLSASTVSKGAISSTVSTSAATGYTSLVKYDNTLTAAGPFTIPATSGGTIVAGTSEYGAASSDSGNTIGIWSPTSCTTGVAESNATALSTTFQAYASHNAAVTNEATTLCFLAGITAAQAPGTYTSTATLVTTALF